MRELVILAHVPTDSVNEGFIPAARRLGLKIILLTDQAEAHRQHFDKAPLVAYPDEIIACDVFNPIAVIESIVQRSCYPAGVFSNSDHLQTVTAISAKYFGLPAKDWRVTYRAKHKAEMRNYLATQGIDKLWHVQISERADIDSIKEQVTFPCVLKPSEGVASQHVYLISSQQELYSKCSSIWESRPGQNLIIEEFLEGPLYTLETLGCGTDFNVLGGFRVQLSPPPSFIELEAYWNTELTVEIEREVVKQLRAFGIGFGACHTEFVLTPNGPRLIEINYRSIGDHRDFLMQEALGIDYFATVLRLHIGEIVEFSEFKSKVAAIRYFVADKAGVLVHAPEHFRHTENDALVDYKSLRETGDNVLISHSNKDYLGVLRGTATNPAILDEAMRRASSNLRWELQS